MSTMVTETAAASPAVSIEDKPHLSARFVRDAHRLVQDLTPRASRYWTDFLLTTVVAYGGLASFLLAAPFSIAQVVAFVLTGLAIYRAVIFTHEIAHRRTTGSFGLFAGAWNLFCGIPFLVPSFLYGDHKGHHTNQGYGTWADPEYIMRSRRWRLRVTIFLLLPVAYPLFFAIRFLVLTPLALMSRRIDRFVWTCCSSLYIMNESYRRERDATASSFSRWLQEVACCAWAWTIVGLAAAQRIPVVMLGKIYLVFLFWLAINQVRTLVAHRYRNQPDEAVTYLDQLLDTNTFPYGRWIPELWAPVGLRYHALHHLLPMLPYHALRDGHDRLMASLPTGSEYHQTVRRGLWSALAAMLNERRQPEASSHMAVSPVLRADPPGPR